MRSLYVAILLAMAGTLSLSLVVFLAISEGEIERRHGLPDIRTNRRTSIGRSP